MGISEEEEKGTEGKGETIITKFTKLKSDIETQIHITSEAQRTSSRINVK